MTRSTALGLLRQGNTGEEILSILDVIQEMVSESGSETLWDTPVGVYKGDTIPLPY